MNILSKKYPRRDFLQSESWLKFQAATGKKVFSVQTKDFQANIIEHNLPIIGAYFYIPKGLIFKNENNKVAFSEFEKIILAAKENKVAWIRLDLTKKSDYLFIKENIKNKICRAPHDMQPKEIFKIDIFKSEAELLLDMKPKTRYNIKLAQKRGVQIKKYSALDDGFAQAMGSFLNILNRTTQRKGIKAHNNDYYEKMFTLLPAENIQLYVAEYKNEIVAANINICYRDTAIYLHGATSDNYRNVMAPFLLQWQAILDAKAQKLTRYDFGGIKSDDKGSSWAGITRFKTGFSKNEKPIEFLGSYDIIINPFYYYLYRILQSIKSLI